MKEILRVENLKKIYRSGNTIGEVSFSLHEGEFLGLIGESGCGKSTLARLICGLLQKTSGTIYYRGQNLENYSAEEKRKILRNMQMIFQSPYSSLPHLAKTLGPCGFSRVAAGFTSCFNIGKEDSEWKNSAF